MKYKLDLNTSAINERGINKSNDIFHKYSCVVKVIRKSGQIN